MTEDAAERPRMDVLLHWLCVAKSRSQAAGWCKDGKVTLDGAPVKASYEARAGQVVEVRSFDRSVRFQLVEVPARPVPKNRREPYMKVLSGGGD